MTTPEVAILGGGLAGLHAARLLHRAQVPFQLFEARDRLGGRIHTVDATGQTHDDGFDLGPSWFWLGTQPGLAHLIAELGLAVFAQHTAGDMLFERSGHERPERVKAVGQDQGSMRLAGGMGALVRALANDLPADCIHLNTRVIALRLIPDGVALTIEGGGQQSEQVTARHVISTLPPRLMADAIGLDPAMDTAIISRWRATPTWMAPHAKFFAVYDRPFWQQDGLSGMAQSLVGPLAEIHDATTASGKAALFGFVGLPAAARATLPQDAIIHAVIEQITRLFGPQAAKPQATLLKDWATDRFTATEADSMSSAHPVATRAPMVTGVWTDRLHLAGSETSSTDPGYLAGAVAASHRTVRAMRERRAT